MFSVIIANWNGAKLIGKCLDSLNNQSYKEFNVYVVDNGSSDDSIKIIEDFKDKIKVEIIRLETNEGFAKANNLGISEAIKDSNDYILTLNNDIELEKDCLKNLKKFINENRQYDIFQILMLNYFERDIIDATGIYFDKNFIGVQQGYKEPYSNIDEYETNIMGACAGAAVYSKKCLEAVKDKNGDYFDSFFFAYNEDVDLAFRLLNKGYKTSLVKEAVVYHMHSATSNKNSSFKEYYIARNLLLYLYKNLDAKDFSSRKLSYIKLFGVRGMRYLVKGNFELLGALFRGIRDYYKNRSIVKDKVSI